MVIAIILILFAVALFLIFHDDHDRSYTRNDPKSGRENGRKDSLSLYLIVLTYTGKY